METVLIVIAAIVIIIGIGGCVLPIIPGPPIAFVGLLILHFSGDNYEFGTWTLVMFGILAVAITILDFVVPAWGTKKFGGTKWGSRGSTIGLLMAVIGFPVLGIAIPLLGGLMGIILGPFLGAVIGEKLGGMETKNALKSGFGSFIGFLAGTFVKLIYCFVILGSFFMKLDFIPDIF